MGMFAYCHKCEAGLNKPTIFQVEYDMWNCRNDHHNPLPEGILASIVGDLEDRITQLESILERMT